MIACYASVFIKILYYSSSQVVLQRVPYLSLVKPPSHLFSGFHKFSLPLALSSSDDFYFLEPQYPIRDWWCFEAITTKGFSFPFSIFHAYNNYSAMIVQGEKDEREGYFRVHSVGQVSIRQPEGVKCLPIWSSWMAGRKRETEKVQNVQT